MLYHSAVGIASLWNEKARAWRKGRREVFNELEAVFPIREPLIWVHASSAGEFEQAKPVIEAVKAGYPHHKVLVSFFSPSGYRQGKKWPAADYVCYLPADTAAHAARMVRLLKPQLVLWVKYDYWYFHLRELHRQQVPLLLVSALFRRNQVFFKSRWYRSMLRFFTHLFVQDQESVALLQQFGIQHCSTAGDTRFDRVAEIAGRFQPVPFLDIFAQDSMLLVAGSTWPEDESFLAQALAVKPDLKLVIAPHELQPGHLAQIEKLFPGCLRYSGISKATDAHQLVQARVLLIDNVGMLSRLYYYGAITYIGGGFNRSGIHNTLEAAVYGKPVLFGPSYKKFREARDLLTAGAAFSYTTLEELKGHPESLLHNAALRGAAGTAAALYVAEHKGATDKILQFIQEKRLLTN